MVQVPMHYIVREARRFNIVLYEMYAAKDFLSSASSRFPISSFKVMTLV